MTRGNGKYGAILRADTASSRLSVPVTADQEYFLIVDGYGKYHGNYSLSVTFVTTTTTTTTLP